MSIKCTEDFINEAIKTHGDKYDYSESKYINAKTKVKIICPIHGEFWQRPRDHAGGTGCPMCAGCVKRTTEDFINEAKIIHGDKYDYSKVDYKNNKTNVIIKCNVCGAEYEQNPHSHLSGCGCWNCARKEAGIKSRKSNSTFILQAKLKHGDKYDYSKTLYINDDTKVEIICPKHGSFWQRPSSHLSGVGCSECAHEKYRLTTESFINKSKLIHGNYYDYSKVNYITTYDPVTIICPKHGEFLQRPIDHIQGHGCHKCNKSKLELETALFLDSKNIKYISEKTFEWLNIDNNLLRLDYFLPEYNIAIECHGKQHFIPVDYFGGVEQFEKQKTYDKIKQDLCLQHNIKIYYYSNYIEDNYELGIVWNNLNLIFENENKTSDCNEKGSV